MACGVQVRAAAPARWPISSRALYYFSSRASFQSAATRPVRKPAPPGQLLPCFSWSLTLALPARWLDVRRVSMVPLPESIYVPDTTYPTPKPRGEGFPAMYVWLAYVGFIIFTCVMMLLIFCFNRWRKTRLLARLLHPRYGFQVPHQAPPTRSAPSPTIHLSTSHRQPQGPVLPSLSQRPDSPASGATSRIPEHA